MRSTRCSASPVPPSRSPSSKSALPRLACVIAPVERHVLAGCFLQRLAIGRNRLLQPRRTALPLPTRNERVAEIVLRRRHDAQDSGRSHKLQYVKSRRERHRGASQDDVFSSLFRVLSPDPTNGSASLGIKPDTNACLFKHDINLREFLPPLFI